MGALYLWQDGLVTVGDLVVIQLYVFTIFFALERFGKVIERTYKSLAEMKEMVEILETPHEVVDKPDAKAAKITEGAIVFKKVRFGYENKKNVIRGLDLQIQPGEKVGIVGHSGAGKSTLTSLLLRYYDLKSGSIEIDGQDISKVTQDSLSVLYFFCATRHYPVSPYLV